MGRNRGLKGGIWEAVPRCSNCLGCLETPKDFQFPFPKTDSVGLGWRPGFCICDSETSARSLPPSICTLYLVRFDTECKQVPEKWTGQQQGSLERAWSLHSGGTASMVDRNSSPRVRLDSVPPQCGPGPVTSKCLSLSLLSLAFVK